jgi:hypothetical protein
MLGKPAYAKPNRKLLMKNQKNITTKSAKEAHKKHKVRTDFSHKKA